MSTESQVQEGVSLDAQGVRLAAYAQALDLVDITRDEGVIASAHAAGRSELARLRGALHLAEG